MVIFLIALAVLIYFVYRKQIWSLSDHSEVYHNLELKPDAKIVDIKTEKVQYVKNDVKYKTPVSFSDGFSFVTHQTDREDHFFTYNISVGSELYKQIIAKAVEAHNRALEQYMSETESN